jgi:hypothetical protein
MEQLGPMGRPRGHPRGLLLPFLPLQVSKSFGYHQSGRLLTWCSCFSARRRRRAGRQPFYGTGWAGRAPPGHGQAQYNPSYQQTQQAQTQAPPTYGQTEPHGGYYGNGENQAYFGGRQNDVEMQPPQNAYRGGDSGYQPPPGPPPNKV